MTLALETPGLLSLAVGFTDNGSLPVDLVAATAGELAAEGPETLQYGTNQGRASLRRILAERLARTEKSHSADDLARRMFVTNGSQQALYLAVQVLCDPGDIILVDRPSYFVFLEMLQGLGVHARSIPVDAEGRVDAEGLRTLLERMHRTGEADRLRAVYFVGYFSNPSARTLHTEEKRDIARVLFERGLCLPVIEDAAYRDLYFDKPSSHPSILELPEWSRFPRLYLSTLTKSFATGLKVGYGVCTDESWLQKMLHVKSQQDFGTAHYNQALLERVLGNGGFDRQLERVRSVYSAKMDALHSTLLASALPARGWRWRRPEGGLYLWLQAPAHVDTGAEGRLCQACLQGGVIYVPGDLCFGDDPSRNYARLSFGVLAPRELVEAGRRFASVAARFS